MSKLAIVFGSNGYLGRHICLQLKKQQINFLPIGFSNESIDGYENYLQIDICDKKQVQKLNLNCDYLFLFAGKTGGFESFENADEFIQVNEIGLIHILNHFISGNKKARIIYPSTRVVYEGKENQALKEDDFKNPKSIYAQTKLNAENYLLNYANLFDFEFTIFRICLPYGNEFDSQYSYGTIGFFLKQALENKEIVIYGEGSQGRTLTHVNDLSKIIIQSLVVNQCSKQLYNMGGDDMSIVEIADKIAKKFNVKTSHEKWNKMALKMETGSTVFDDFKLRNDLKIAYDYNFESWLSSLH